MDKIHKKIIFGIFLIVFSISIVFNSNAQIYPTEVNSFTHLGNYSPSSNRGSSFNSSGGSITISNINITTQNPRWKAYVGNITGAMSLGDEDGAAIYAWQLATITGELYATRSPDIIDWANIQCADYDNISAEQIALNITTTEIDSINNTFNQKNHNRFYTATTLFNANSCYSAATYVNNTPQSSSFQEIILHDTKSMVYTALLENNTYGFNNETYDYQIILPENALEAYTSSTAYYFYIELI